MTPGHTSKESRGSIQASRDVTINQGDPNAHPLAPFSHYKVSASARILICISLALLVVNIALVGYTLGRVNTAISTYENIEERVAIRVAEKTQTIVQLDQLQEQAHLEKQTRGILDLVNHNREFFTKQVEQAHVALTNIAKQSSRREEVELLLVARNHTLYESMYRILGQKTPLPPTHVVTASEP